MSPRGTHPMHSGEAERPVPPNVRLDEGCVAVFSGMRATRTVPAMRLRYSGEPLTRLVQDLPLGLFGELWVAVAFYQVLRDLEVPERLEGPFRMPDRGLGAVDDLVLPAPEQELADPLGELPRGAYDEVDGRS